MKAPAKRSVGGRFRSPRLQDWPIRWKKMSTPFRERMPLEEAIRAAIAWDRPLTFQELRERIASSPELLERLFQRAQTVDWIVELLGPEGLRQLYPRYRKVTRRDLKEEIEKLWLRPRRR